MSIIPWGGPVTVSAAGLRWPLRDEVLHPHHTRGISNETTGPLTRIDVASGLAWIIAADAVETGAFNS